MKTHDTKIRTRKEKINKVIEKINYKMTKNMWDFVFDLTYLDFDKSVFFGGVRRVPGQVCLGAFPNAFRATLKVPARSPPPRKSTESPDY